MIYSKLRDPLIAVLRTRLFWIFGSVALILFLSCLAFQSGITYDEYEDMRIARAWIDYALAGTPSDTNGFFGEDIFKYYGQGFGLIAYPFQALSMDSAAPMDWRNLATPLLVKHVLILWFSLLNYVFIAKALRREGFSRRGAWLGASLLGCCLYFLGHSFFNGKDIPFATAMTVTTYFMARFLSRPRDGISGKNALILGLLIGFSTCLRFGGLIQLVHLLILLLLVPPKDGGKVVSVERVGFFLLTTVTVFLVTYIGYPVFWREPTLIMDALSYMNDVSKRGFDGFNLLWGVRHPAEKPVWYYLISWYLVKTPVLIGGLVVFSFYDKIVSRKWSAYEIAFALQLFSLPLIATLGKSVIYNGIRHFLLTFPALAFFAALALRKLWSVRPKLAVGLVLAQFLVSGMDLITLRSDAYMVFNEVARFFPMDRLMEVDYWNESVRATSVALNERPLSSRPQTLVVNYIPCYAPFLKEGFLLEKESEFNEFSPSAANGFWVSHNFRQGKPERFEDCKIIYERRVHAWGGKPMLVNRVRECPAP